MCYAVRWPANKNKSNGYSYIIDVCCALDGRDGWLTAPWPGRTPDQLHHPRTWNETARRRHHIVVVNVGVIVVSRSQQSEFNITVDYCQCEVPSAWFSTLWRCLNRTRSFEAQMSINRTTLPITQKYYWAKRHQKLAKCHVAHFLYTLRIIISPSRFFWLTWTR